MPGARPGRGRFSDRDLIFAPKRKEKPVPHAFVLDALERVAPTTRPLFGCLAVYVGEKVVLALREKGVDDDDGVWIATTKDHHASLVTELPSMRSIGVLGDGVTGWQILPSDSPDFEEEAIRACELILAGDPRIGKIPAPRRVRLPAETAEKGQTRGAKKVAAKKVVVKKTGTKKVAAKKAAMEKTGAKKATAKRGSSR